MDYGIMCEPMQGILLRTRTLDDRQCVTPVWTMVHREQRSGPIYYTCSGPFQIFEKRASRLH